MESKLTDKELAGIAERLIESRKQRRLSQDQLSVKSGVTKQTISKVETASREMQSGTAVRLAESLDVSLDYLLRGMVGEADFLIWYRKIHDKLNDNQAKYMFEMIDLFIRMSEDETTK